MMLADAARVQVSVRKMVAGLRWFHTGHIHPPDDGFEVFMLNVAQVGEHFRDPDNVRNFQLATRGVYQDPIVSRTFFYRWAITPENSLWYFVFFRQNVLIAFTGGLPIVGTEPSNDCVNPPAGDGLSAK
jgi:hypothetical protein